MELPGGPGMATPKNHQRRGLVVPAFVARLLAWHLADGLNVFVLPGRQSHTATRQRSHHGFRRRFFRAIAGARLADVAPHDLHATHAGSVRTRAASWWRPGANARVTIRHYARAMDDRDAHVAAPRQASEGKPTGT
jgi:integrase